MRSVIEREFILADPIETKDTAKGTTAQPWWQHPLHGLATVLGHRRQPREALEAARLFHRKDQYHVAILLKGLVQLPLVLRRSRPDALALRDLHILRVVALHQEEVAVLEEIFNQRMIITLLRR